MLSLRTGLAVAVALVALAAACSSLPDITFADLDAAAVEGGGIDGGVDGRVIDPNCKSTGAEICDDGFDNDCDGLTDCQDLKCTGGFSCQDAPTDWTVVAFAASAQPACPPNETTTALKVTAGDGTGSCTCSCSSVGGNCSGGNFTVTISNDVACGTATATGNVPTSSGCAAIPTPFSMNGTHAKMTPPAPPSCTPNPVLNGALTNGRLCQAPKVGKGCPTNQVCAPKPTTGLASCVTKAGKSACPTGFAKRSTAGTDAAEGRMCTGCTCNAPAACFGGSVSLYNNSMCATNGASKNGAKGITQTCNTATPDIGFSATHFEATPPTGGCATTPATGANLTGGVAFTAERTVCCK